MCGTVKGTEQTLRPGAPRQRQLGQRREWAEHGPYPLDCPETEWGEPLCKEAAGIRLNPGTCLSPFPDPTTPAMFPVQLVQTGRDSHNRKSPVFRQTPARPNTPPACLGPRQRPRLPQAGEGTWRPTASWEPAAAEQR